MTTRRRVRSARAAVPMGCIVALVLMVLLVVGVGVYVAISWKGWVAGVTTAMAEAVVKDSGLPDDQKDQILAEVRKLGADFKAGRITTEDLQKVLNEVAESPLLPLAAVQAARQKYIEPSNMTAEEKAAAVRSLQRFARGVYEKKIKREAIDEVVKPIMYTAPNGQEQFKPNPTRAEVDEFVANAKKKADEAGVPDEPYDLNIAEELKKAIAKALKKEGGEK